MKRILCILLTLCILTPVPSIASTYTTYGVIEAIDYIEDTYKVTDLSGNVWLFDEVEDWWILDYVEMTIDNMNTLDPSDDIVLTCHWTGHNEMDRQKLSK